MISTRNLAAAIGLIVLASSQLMTAQVAWNEDEELRDIGQLMTRWNDAYRLRDAKGLAALEAGEVEIVDRFGESHRLTTPSEKEAFWADGFAMIAKDNLPSELTMGRIRLVALHAASVHTCVHFRDGIRLDNGARIPLFWELNSYLLVKSNGKWRIVEMGIHDQAPPEGCAASR